MERIPFNDLQSVNREASAALRDAFERVLSHQEFILGSEVAEFEREWWRLLGAGSDGSPLAAVGCASGTDALILALETLGIGPGDEVITTPLSFFATAEAVLAVGAKPVFVDALPASGLIDSARLESALTARTKAVLPAHLYGQAADMSAILEFTRRHGLKCVEDAAQAHGVRYGDRMLGTWGDAGCYSFFPGKSLGALGDAGALVTRDPALAELARSLRDHGRSGKYEHQFLSANRRMDGLQAAFLRAKLCHLKRWNQNRIRIATAYREGLTGVEGLRLLPYDTAEAPHLYVILHSDRDKLARSLEDAGIGTGVHYPIPCHLQPAWRKRFGDSTFPIAEEFSRTCLSLPLSGTMTVEQAETVIGRIRNACDARKSG